MAENKKVPSSLDEEYQQILKMEGDAIADDNPPQEPSQQGGEGGEPKDSQPEPTPKEGAPKAETSPDKGTDTGEGEPDKGKQGEDAKDQVGTGDDLDTKEPPKRQERYIPIKKYHDLQRKWRSEKEELEQKIAQLQAMAEAKKQSDAGQTTPAQDAANEDEIKAFAEKYGYDEDALKELVGIIAKSQKPALPKDIEKALEMVQEIASEKREQEYFENEWEQSVTPLIKEQFPNASPEAVQKAKALMDELAHTRKLRYTPLDVIFKAHSEFREILGEPGTEKRGRKTAESGRPTAMRGGMSLTLSDITKAKSNPEQLIARFRELNELTNTNPEKAKEIIAAMDPDTYDSYFAFLAQLQEEEGVAVRREGKKVLLK